MSHSAKIMISQLIILIPFGGLIVQVEFGHLFPIVIVNLA